MVCLLSYLSVFHFMVNRKNVFPSSWELPCLVHIFVKQQKCIVVYIHIYIHIYTYMYNNTCIEIQLLGFKNNISLRQVGINAHGIQSSSWTKIQCFQNKTQRQVAPPAQFQLEWQTLTSIYATMVSWTYLSRCKTKQHFDIVCWATVAVLDPLLGPAQQNLFTNASVTNTNWANKKNKSHKRCKIQLLDK